MLQLKNITKVYGGATPVHALKGVDLQLRASEFVSILGPSGCGKTTLLNLIGGLDKYTAGDLLVDGKSTRDFSDGEWDAYRNRTVGFVFQTYNLIAHLSVLDNVAIALTLSGVSLDERKKRAAEALASVGLLEQIHKKPNQLSGGQMQRVAIARSLVNNPKILLADEPTGALDSETSVQIMEILKEIARSRLVVMVTHNQELAKQYSDRIVQLKDGVITGDSMPAEAAGAEPRERLVNKKTSMSWITAIRLSFKNLMTKKKRTVLTSIAGSIGIIGVALVLALSSGMTSYVNGMQSDALAGFPLTISQTATTFGGMGDGFYGAGGGSENQEFPAGDTIFSYDRTANTRVHTNAITSNYIDYLNAMDASLYNAVSYSYGLEMTVVAKADNGSYKKVSTGGGSGIFGSSGYFNEMPDSGEFIKSQYDILENGGAYPGNASEAALIVDSRNRLDVRILAELGIAVTESYKFSDLLGRTFKVINNNDLYTETGGVFIAGTDYGAMYHHADSVALTIVGILRVKESASSELLSSGIGYTTALTEKMLGSAKTSDVAAAQAAAGETKSVLTGAAFSNLSTDSYQSVMRQIGADAVPTGVQIYPVNFDAKESVKAYLDAYNAGRPADERIIYSDLAETMTSMISTMINTISIVLIAFAAISLVVSTIMIGIITYVSVVERTKEIGILRAIGARKKDVSRIFNAET
ncbi:MAG: ABC transporter ATP-binding protein/permease, partial [Firmicutes bacterium]|nr:ABC transporter ATP-binding protein/permease [Bacillota bacterium]